MRYEGAISLKFSISWLVLWPRDGRCIHGVSTRERTRSETSGTCAAGVDGQIEYARR